ncbi:DnaA/Hda family protein [Pelagibacteraceae bacterium]|nr:DnaA/Hda family protein [Pelagibacteraceae bacterium]
MTGQLIFDLPTSQNYNPQDYFVSSSNNNAAKLIKIFPEWHNNGIVVFGPAKSGKTHIAYIWKSMANANLYDFKSNFDINTININGNCIFDNFDCISEKDEKSFFQIYNYIIKNKKFILILISNDNFSVNLRDLQSRIDALNSAKLNNPDDKLIHAIVLKFFHDNQIIVAPDVINFILNRISRNFNEIQIFLNKLNDLSIKHKSKISIPFLNKFFTF